MSNSINTHAFHKRSSIAAVVLKIIAVVASIYGIMLTKSGLMSFTYFTNLSNVMIDVILIIFLIFDFKELFHHENQEKSNTLYIVKFMFTISITLTFLIFLFLLAPTSKDGILDAYFSNHAASFCVHFLTPVLAILDFFLFDYHYKNKPIHSLYAIIPPLGYVGLVIVLEKCGIRWHGNMKAPYNFLNYGASTGWFGFNPSIISSETLGIGVFYMILVLVLIFIVIGLTYLHLLNFTKKKHK